MCWRCVCDPCGGCSPGVSSLSPSWSSGWAPLSLLPGHAHLSTGSCCPQIQYLTIHRYYTTCCAGNELAIPVLWRLLPGALQPEPQLELWVGAPLPAPQQPGHAHLSTGCCCLEIQYLTVHRYCPTCCAGRCVNDSCGGCSPGVSSLSPSWSSGWVPLSLLPSSRVMLTSPQGVAVRISNTLQYTDTVPPVVLALCKRLLWRLLPRGLQPEPQLELWVGAPPCSPAARSCSPLHGVLPSADPIPYRTQTLSHLLCKRCVNDCCGGAPLPAPQQPGHAHLSMGCCCPQIQYLTVHRYCPTCCAGVV